MASADEANVLYIPKVSNNAVTIDAVKDAAYNASETLPLHEQNIDAFQNSPMDSLGEFWLCYDQYYVYLFVDIEDSHIDYSNPDPQSTWLRESIGVMFDFDYNRHKEYEYTSDDNICYINLSGDGVVVTYHKYDKNHVNGLYEKIQTKTIKQTNDNHIIYELALPIPDEISREEGTKFGFEICAPNAMLGTRVGCLSWSEYGYEMYHYTDVCGTAFLGDSPEKAGDADISSLTDKDGDKDNNNNDDNYNINSDKNAGTNTNGSSLDMTKMLIILGCVLGGIILLLIIGLVVFFIVRNSKKKAKKKAKKEAKKEAIKETPEEPKE